MVEKNLVSYQPHFWRIIMTNNTPDYKDNLYFKPNEEKEQSLYIKRIKVGEIEYDSVTVNTDNKIEVHIKPKKAKIEINILFEGDDDTDNKK